MTVCTNCEWTIDGSPVDVAGVPFCCTGCAAGGPCTCAYTQCASQSPAGDDAGAAAGQVSRPAGWSLVSRRLEADVTADDGSVLPAPRRARLGTDRM